MWHKIFARSNFCDFCNFFNNQQKYVAAKKISCEHFPTKINFTPEQIFSNLNSLHKNTAVHIRNCVDLCLLSFGKEKIIRLPVLLRIRTPKLLFENMYFHCRYSIKSKTLSMICPGLSANRKN